jgi:hypothetical protein
MRRKCSMSTSGSDRIFSLLYALVQDLHDLAIVGDNPPIVLGLLVVHRQEHKGALRLGEVSIDPRTMAIELLPALGRVDLVLDRDDPFVVAIEVYAHEHVDPSPLSEDLH